MTTRGHPLDRCDLEFLCVAYSANILSLFRTLWFRGVYDSRGVSRLFLDSSFKFAIYVKSVRTS